EAWSRGRAAARRLAALSALPVPVPATGDVEPVLPPARLRVAGVSFRYGNASPQVLDNLSLDVSVGDRVIIAGHSGAGKTTLAALLLRFLSPQSGAIRLDDADLAGL